MRRSQWKTNCALHLDNNSRHLDVLKAVTTLFRSKGASNERIAQEPP